MNILFLIIGIGLGVVEMFLTKKYTSKLLSSDPSGVTPYFLLKTLVLAVLAVLSGILIFNESYYWVWLISGFCAGFIISAIVNAIVKGGKDRDDS